MAITVHTDFNAKYKLANTAPSDPEGADLAIFINDYEDEYLNNMLGYKLAKDFKAGIASNPTSGKWFNLWKGAEFTDKNGKLNKWPGFRNAEDLNPIVMYIYFKWQNSRQSYSSGNGERQVLTENSVPFHSSNKNVKAWNDMVTMNFILDDFLTQNKADYPDYPGVYGSLGSYGNVYLFKTINVLGI